MLYKIWDIHYDTDGDASILEELPMQIYVDIYRKGDVSVEELLSEAISEVTGFCHFGFKYKPAGALEEVGIKY